MNAPTAPLKETPTGGSTLASGAAPRPHHTNLDFGQATQFLKLLSPQLTGVTFQTFDDDKVRKKPELIRVIQFEDFKKLQQLNADGAGIFVTINETDELGRKKENIVRVRAVFQEDDDGFDGPFPLEPSMVIESSPGHFHRYWLVADEWLAGQQGHADFAAVMARMVESYGSDKNAKDISRVLRLPGFLHRKGKPHLVCIVEASGHRYSRADIIRAFPPVERAKKAHTERAWAPQDDDERRIRSALYSIDPHNRDVWLDCAMAIKDHLGGAGRQLWDDWSKQSKKYDESDQERTWNSLKRDGITIRTLFHHAQQTGWRDDQRSFERAPGGSKPAGEPAASEHDLDSEWPRLDEAAYHGIVGDIVRTISPHTEADPVAILMQVLTLAGNAIGRSPHYRVRVLVAVGPTCSPFWSGTPPRREKAPHSSVPRKS